MEPGAPLEDYSNSTATVFQEVPADKVKFKVTNTWGTILDMVEDVVEELLHGCILNAQMIVYTMVYDALELEAFVQIRTVVLDETTDKHVDRYCEAGQAAEAVGKRLHRNDESPTQIASFIQPTMDAITKQCRVSVLGSRSM